MVPKGAFNKHVGRRGGEGPPERLRLRRRRQPTAARPGRAGCSALGAVALSRPRRRRPAPLSGPLTPARGHRAGQDGPAPAGVPRRGRGAAPSRRGRDRAAGRVARGRRRRVQRGQVHGRRGRRRGQSSSAARTVPMMAPKRFVLVRGAERWDAGGGRELAARPAGRVRRGPGRLDVPGDRRGRSSTAGASWRSRARKQGFLVTCDPLDARALPAWIADRFASKGPRGRPRRGRAARRRWRGPQLSSVDDAIERLSLYVGAGRADRRGRRRRLRRARAHGRHLGAGRRGGRARPRPGARARSPTPTTRASADCRCSARWRGRSGSSRATRRPSSRARRPTRRRAAPGSSSLTARGSSPPRRARCRPREVERWLLVLAETDLALKSSRRTADAILEEMLTRLCRAETRGRGAGIRTEQERPDAVEPAQPFDGTSARPYLCPEMVREAEPTTPRNSGKLRCTSPPG